MAHDSCSTSRDGFPLTRWTLLFALRDPATSEKDRKDILGALFEAYRKPILLAIQWHLKGSSLLGPAEDLLHAFVRDAWIGGKLLTGAKQREQGRFRFRIRAAISSFITDQWRKASALKRGGLTPPISLEECHEESGVTAPVPTEIFDLAWARATLERAAQRMLDEKQVASIEEFRILLEAASSRKEAGGALARRLEGCGIKATPRSVTRKLRDFREALPLAVRQEIADVDALSYSDHEMIEDEYRYFLRLICLDLSQGE